MCNNNVFFINALTYKKIYHTLKGYICKMGIASWDETSPGLCRF